MEKYPIWFRSADDSTLPEIKQYAEETRKSRVKSAFERLIENAPDENDLNVLFAKMYLGQEVESVNERLYDYFVQSLREYEEDYKSPEKSTIKTWTNLDGFLGVMSFYFCFGKDGRVAKDRLFDKTCDALLDYLWAVTRIPNDANISKLDTFWVNSSENHDLGHKASCLFSSFIFMNVPKYKDRLYPNEGKGFKAEKKSPMSKTVTERPIKEKKPEEQYLLWLDFFYRYFNDRARKGFFIEHSSPGYMKWTLSVIYGIMSYIPDKTLKQKAKNFLDIVWIDWALQQFGGIHGGAKTRHHYNVGEVEESSMTCMARFLLGGEGRAELSYKQLLLSDYNFNDGIIELMLDRQSAQEFVYTSRAIAEEDPILPRPAGTDYTMMCNVPQRAVRYTYVTPSYMLSSQAEHPRAMYNHLAVSGRWFGFCTPYSKKNRVVPVALDPSIRLSAHGERYSTDLVCNVVQHKNVLILQQKLRLYQVNGAMMPACEDIFDRNMGLYIGKDWDEKVIKGGIIFLRKGDAYVSIRIIMCKTDKDPLAWARNPNAEYVKNLVLHEQPYSYDEDYLLRLNNRVSPIIIEAASEGQIGSFDTFIEKVTSAKCELFSTIVRFETRVIIKYKGIFEDSAELMFNAANVDEIPTVNGKEIDYSPDTLFSSPYFNSEYNSGKITFNYKDYNKDYVF